MKALARRQVFLVAGRALLMLPVFMALWYFAGTPLTWIPAVGATPILRAVSGGSVAMHQKGRDVTYTVKLEMPYRPGVTPRVAVDVEVAAAKFTYGIALFLALCLAAKESHNGVGIVVGSAVLLVLPMVGIAFDALKQLAVTPGMLTFLMWGRGTGEGVALGYQVGTLLLPTLAPVVIWLGLARKLWAPEPESEAARPRTTA